MSEQVLKVLARGLLDLGVEAAGIDLKQTGLDLLPVGVQLLRTWPAATLEPAVVDAW